MALSSQLLIPLYIYPNPGAWDILFDSIRNHPSLHFTIVVNPNSGPGCTPLPDENYIAALETLTSLSRHNQAKPCSSSPGDAASSAGNVRIIGYVATTYGKKPLTNIEAEIAIYAGWSARTNGKIKVDGIFLDETPFDYVPNGTGRYYWSIHKTIKGISELGDRLVVVNPGAVADPRFALCADVIVVFEETYKTYRARRRDDRHLKYTHGLFGHLFQEADDNYVQNGGAPQAPINKRFHIPPQHDVLTASSVPFSKACMGAMIHSCPADLLDQEIELLVEDVSEMFGWIFFTDLSAGYYAEFGQRFKDFVRILDVGVASNSSRRQDRIGNRPFADSAANQPSDPFRSDSSCSPPPGAESQYTTDPTSSDAAADPKLVGLKKGKKLISNKSPPHKEAKIGPRSRSRFRLAFEQIKRVFFPSSSAPTSPTMTLPTPQDAAPSNRNVPPSASNASQAMSESTAKITESSGSKAAESSYISSSRSSVALPANNTSRSPPRRSRQGSAAAGLASARARIDPKPPGVRGSRPHSAPSAPFGTPLYPAAVAGNPAVQYAGLGINPSTASSSRYVTRSPPSRTHSPPERYQGGSRSASISPPLGRRSPLSPITGHSVPQSGLGPMQMPIYQMPSRPRSRLSFPLSGKTSPHPLSQCDNFSEEEEDEAVAAAKAEAEAQSEAADRSGDEKGKAAAVVSRPHPPSNPFLTRDQSSGSDGGASASARSSSSSSDSPSSARPDKASRASRSAELRARVQSRFESRRAGEKGQQQQAATAVDGGASPFCAANDSNSGSKLTKPSASAPSERGRARSRAGSELEGAAGGEQAREQQQQQQARQSLSPVSPVRRRRVSLRFSSKMGI